MKHHLLKIDTDTRIDIDTRGALEPILFMSYGEQLAVREMDAAAGGRYDPGPYDNAYRLLLANKGLERLRELIYSFYRKNGAAILREMIDDLSVEYADGGQFPPAVEVLIDNALEELVRPGRRHLYEKLFNFAVVDQLYDDGYEFYRRDTADLVMERADPESCGDFLLMLATSGRVAATRLLRDSHSAGSEDDSLRGITPESAMIFLSLKMADLILRSAVSIAEIMGTGAMLESEREEEEGDGADEARETGAASEGPEAGAQHPQPVAGALPDAAATSAPDESPAPSEPGLVEPGESLELTTRLRAAEEERGRLAEELRHAREQAAAATQAERRQKYLNSVLTQQFSQSTGGKARKVTTAASDGEEAGGEDEAGQGALAEFIRRAVGPKLTPAEALEVLGLLFPAKVTVLPSALKSAGRSEVFRDRRGAFDLLWRLATAYRDALASGKGDNEARRVFSASEFAPTDGARGERARDMRRFEYKGDSREFQKHLRLGVKESPAETLRIYFDYDSAEKKVVIAYCGPHLRY